MLRKILAAAVVMSGAWGCAQPSAAAAAPVRSGFYEGLVLAVSPTGRVVGHFNMEQGEGVVKRCIFDFAGQMRGNQAIIHSAGSPRLTGRITATSADEISFSMAHVKDLPGCGLVLPPEAETAGGTELDLIKPGAWTDLATVKSARVAFKATPGGAGGRAYMVKGDVVGILGRQGNQVKVVYPSERDTWAQGWVAAADLAASRP
ncbi:hypothetical protein [Sphingomonas faeni]|uniref:hypothetical protein n=1 Tax=Sphingomonas faeni TaxID=185950 RepID=UPI0033508167